MTPVNFFQYTWPWADVVPAVHYDARADDGDEDQGSMHAKCVVVDDSSTFADALELPVLDVRRADRPAAERLVRALPVLRVLSIDGVEHELVVRRLATGEALFRLRALQTNLWPDATGWVGLPNLAVLGCEGEIANHVRRASAMGVQVLVVPFGDREVAAGLEALDHSELAELRMVWANGSWMGRVRPRTRVVEHAWRSRDSRKRLPPGSVSSGLPGCTLQEVEPFDLFAPA